MTLEQKLKKALKSNNTSNIHTIFEEIYNTYVKLVYFTIMKYIQNSRDIEDLTQEVFISFFNNLSNIEFKSIKYYLVVSAKNKSINFLKKQNINVVFDDELVYQQEDFNNETSYLILIENMKNYLSDYEIEVIIEHTIYNLSFKQIAKNKNKSINTVISTYYRAISKYKKGENKYEKK
jgi:RNA polymerase sigma-70 factor (ECF subfamily)